MWLKVNNSGYLKELEEDSTNAESIGEKYGGLSINRIEASDGNTRFRGEHSVTDIPTKYKSIKVKGILRITRDLNLTRKNNQVHMVLFLDSNTPENYINMIPFKADGDFDRTHMMKLIDSEQKIYIAYHKYIIKRISEQEGVQFATTWYICSPYENDMDNQKLLKLLLSEKEYTSFMSKRFSCTYVAVECELSDFQQTSYLYHAEDMHIEFYYTNEYDKGIDISIKAEYFTDPGIYPEDYSHAKINNYKVIDKHSVSIYTTKWYHEDYFYSSYAKDGVLVLPCSDDDYINVREKPESNSKIILQIVNVLHRSLLLAYPPDEKWATIPEIYYKEPNGDIIDKIKAYRNYLDACLNDKELKAQNKTINSKYKIYPIFVNDIVGSDWCKVTIYKSNYMPIITDFIDIQQAGMMIDIHNLYKKIVYSPKEVYLMDGYIHASQLHPISVIRVKDTI